MPKRKFKKSSKRKPWPNRGFLESGFDCTSCLRSSSEQDLTNGFFVSCFKRIKKIQASTGTDVKSDECDGVSSQGKHDKCNLATVQKSEDHFVKPKRSADKRKKKKKKMP